MQKYPKNTISVVPFRSRVLSHETKTLNEDKTLNQLVTAPLQKHAVGGCVACSVLYFAACVSIAH
jgi:hypothetical protein